MYYKKIIRNRLSSYLNACKDLFNSSSEIFIVIERRVTDRFRVLILAAQPPRRGLRPTLRKIHTNRTFPESYLKHA